MPEGAADWGRIIGGYRRFLLFGAAAALAIPVLGLHGNAPGLSFQFFRLQDLWVVVAMTLAILWYRERDAATLPWLTNGWTGARVAVTALAIVIIGYAGHVLLFENYDLSRDEQMAAFDGMVFASGRLY
ncbi:MAG: hypothetical protein RLZZ58_1438, partial [Pseudomonadota bacterium]